MSLKDPLQKMSKSHADPRSRILITDTDDEIKAKIKVALTDSVAGVSYDPDTRPGVSNLIEIIVYTSQSPITCQDVVRDMEGLSMRAFKERAAQGVILCLSGVKERYFDLMNGDAHVLRDAVETGKDKARAQAGQTLDSVKQVLGLQPLDKSWDRGPK